MKKIWVLLIIYFLFYIRIYSFDANISVNKEEVSINDYTKVRIEVNHDNTKNIEIKEIKWLDNFVILEKTSWTNSSSNIIVVDWKTTTQSKYSDFIDLIISPKKEGTFDLWPAVIESNDEKKETNIIPIKVLENYKQKDENNYLKNEKKYTIYLFFIIFLFSILGITYYFKKDFFHNFFWRYKMKFIKSKEITLEKNNESKSDIIFDYPLIDDINFTKKINDIFINKIKTKYYIENIEKKSNVEIYSFIKDDLSDKEIIWKIILILNKLKYSNEHIEKNEIIELLKKI